MDGIYFTVAIIALILSLVILYVILMKQKRILESKGNTQEGNIDYDWNESLPSTPRTEYTISGSSYSGQSTSTAEEEGTGGPLSESLLSLYNLIVRSKTIDHQDKGKNEENNRNDDAVATQTPSSLSESTISGSISSDPNSNTEERKKGPTLSRSVLFLHNLILQTKPSDSESKVENQEKEREGPRSPSTQSINTVSSSTYSGRSSISQEVSARIPLAKSWRILYKSPTDTKPSEDQAEEENKEGKSEEDQEGSPPSTENPGKEGEEE